MQKPLVHRSEATGDAALDRIQNNVRTAIARTNELVFAIARTHGIGVKRISMRDANYDVTTNDIEGAVLVFSGTLTAGRTVNMPRATDGQAYKRWIKNTTGQTLTFANADGSATVVSTVTGCLLVSASGPERLE